LPVCGFHYHELQDVLGSWVTWKTYLNTLKYAVIVWALTLFIGSG
jgi:putative spermidine/putrescine transport system permease protein